VAFNRLDESLADTLHKGDHVLVDGHQLVSSKYERENGKSKKEGGEVRHLLERSRELRPAVEPRGSGSARYGCQSRAYVGRRAVLTAMLQVRGRNSHFAFVISRELKRHIFRSASRGSRGAALMDELKENARSRNGHVSFQRITELRHFLDRCLTRGVLTEKELNLLVDFKLNGGQIDESEGLNGTSSNAVHHKLKRWLGKLRGLTFKQIVGTGGGHCEVCQLPANVYLH
jgi:hypothetical protein